MFCNFIESTAFALAIFISSTMAGRSALAQSIADYLGKTHEIVANIGVFVVPTDHVEKMSNKAGIPMNFVVRPKPTSDNLPKQTLYSVIIGGQSEPLIINSPSLEICIAYALSKIPFQGPNGGGASIGVLFVDFLPNLLTIDFETGKYKFLTTTATYPFSDAGTNNPLLSVANILRVENNNLIERNSPRYSTFYALVSEGIHTASFRLFESHQIAYERLVLAKTLQWILKNDSSPAAEKLLEEIKSGEKFLTFYELDGLMKTKIMTSNEVEAKQGLVVMSRVLKNLKFDAVLSALNAGVVPEMLFDPENQYEETLFQRILSNEKAFHAETFGGQGEAMTRLRLRGARVGDVGRFMLP